jgi:hypothetical protein
MTDGAAIATTRSADVQSLGTGGQLAIQAWDQITTYLRRARGPEHAALFAEPNPDPERGVVDWYADRSGPAVPLATLPPAEQEEVRATLTRLIGDIEAESAALKRSAREGDRFMGELLALAIQVPNQDCVRVLAGRPVLIAWAHAPIGGTAEPALLIGTTARPVSLGPMRIVGPPEPVAKRPSALGPLAAGIALLLLPLAAALVWFDPLRWFVASPPMCLARPGEMGLIEELRREQEREGALRTEVARLSRELGDRRVACPPPAALPEQPRRAEAAPSPRPPPPQSADVERAREQGARTGRVQVILAWDNENDLDLSVRCPGGGRIFFQTPRGCGGGQLDVDFNFQGRFGRNAVENIVWASDPPSGHYDIEVMHSGHHRGPASASAFRVTVRVDGVPDRTFEGRVTPHQTVSVGSFTVPAR